MSDGSGPRRRSTQEIRGLILQAARDEFGTHGYDRVRTKDIAARAGVQERLLYSNFGSKSELFGAALVDPLKQVIAEYLQVKHLPQLPIEERVRVFIHGLFELAHSNRRALLSVIGSTAGDPDGPGGELFEQIAATLQEAVDDSASDFPDVDSKAAMLDVAGMVFGVALLDDLLMAQGRLRPSRARLLDEMDKMAAYRLLYHPPDESQRRWNNVETEDGVEA